MQHAYNRLFEMGWAHSFETWKEGVLVGGLYGVAIGTTFFGESMFSTLNNASKYAFVNCCQFLERKGFKVIDCQIHSNHLESLGAYFIERKVFEDLIGDNSERLKCT
jgi:leucyl/phenylalanyl-tRNA--protein transferase